MSWFQLAVCTCLALAFTATGLAAGEAPAPITVASPWVDLHKARVRLIGGARRSKSYVAGVEITLADGWKTYWRNPGDAGVPPVFDWLGSTNVGLVKVLYPAPSRIAEPAAETIGYEHAVLFPVEVTPKDPTKPVELKLLLEFGICREICIPAQSMLSLTIPTAAFASAGSTRRDPCRALACAPPASGAPARRSRAPRHVLAARRTQAAASVRGALSARRQGRRSLHRSARRALCAPAEAACRRSGRDCQIRGGPFAGGHRARPQRQDPYPHSGLGCRRNREPCASSNSNPCQACCARFRWRHGLYLSSARGLGVHRLPGLSSAGCALRRALRLLVAHPLAS